MIKYGEIQDLKAVIARWSVVHKKTWDELEATEAKLAYVDRDGFEPTRAGAAARLEDEDGGVQGHS